MATDMNKMLEDIFKDVNKNPEESIEKAIEAIAEYMAKYKVITYGVIIESLLKQGISIEDAKQIVKIHV